MKYLLLTLVVLMGYSSYGQCNFTNLLSNDSSQASYLQGTEVDMEISNDGIVYIAFKDKGNEGKLVVRKYENNKWESLGEELSIGEVQSPSLVINEFSQVYVAYSDYGLGERLCVKKLGNGLWTNIGDSTLFTRKAWDTKMDIDKVGNLFIAFENGFGNDTTFVVKYDGNGWSYLDTLGITGKYFSGRDMAVDSSGIPYFICLDKLTGFLSLRKYENSTWQNAEFYSSIDKAIHPTLSFSKDNKLFLAYTDNSSYTKKPMIRYLGNNGSWQYYGLPEFSPAASANQIELDIDSTGSPFIAFEERNYSYPGGITVAENEIYNWKILGKRAYITSGNSQTSIGRYRFSFKFDSHDDCYVASIGEDYNYKILVRKYDKINNEWKVLDGGSLSPGKSNFGNSSVRNLSISMSNDTAYMMYSSANRIEEKHHFVKWKNGKLDSLITDTLPDGIFHTSMCVGSDGTTYFAYYKYKMGIELSVKKLQNGTWVDVGAPLVTTNSAYYLDLKIAKDGTLYILYSDGSTQKATVKSFDGLNWNLVGERWFSEGKITYSNLEINSQGVPYVTYSDAGLGYKAIVKQFSNGRWQSVGDSLGLSVSRSYYNTLTFNSNDEPIIFYDKDFPEEGLVKRFNGTDWVMVGNILAGTYIKSEHAICTDSLNNIYIAFSDPEQDNKAVVMNLIDSTWTEIGGGPITVGKAENISLASNSEGKIFVSLSQGGTYLYELDTEFKINLIQNNDSLFTTDGFDEYQWFYDGVLVNGVDTNFIETINQGGYNCVVNQKGCLGKSDTLNYIITALDDVRNFDVKIFPNPASEQVFIQTKEKISSVEIFNISGSVIYSSKMSDKNTIDLSKFNSGFYLMKIKINDEFIFSKLEVVK